MKLNKIMYWSTFFVAVLAIMVGSNYFVELFNSIMFQKKSLALSNMEAVNFVLGAGTVTESRHIQFYIYPVLILFVFFWGLGILYSTRSNRLG